MALSEKIRKVGNSFANEMEGDAAEYLWKLADQAECMEAVVEAIVVECEEPENRGRMTQKQQANFLDGLRAKILAALEENV